MPNTVVNVNLRSATGAVAQETFSDLVIVGDNPTTGGVTHNTPQVYDDATDVANDYGEDSDVHIASQAAESMSADQWWVVMLETTDVTGELIADSDSSSVDAGTLANAPIQGDTDDVTVTLDGDDQTVLATTESPPQGAESGEAVINFDTGEILTGDTTSGTGSGIEVDYTHADWDSATAEMSAHDFDLAVLGDVRADKSYIGEVDELVTWASGNDCSVILALENGGTYPSDTDAMNAYHEIGGYVPSGNLMTIAHKSTDDVAATVAGRCSVKQPWFDPFYDGAANYGLANGAFKKSLIGDPGTAGTLEGGDSVDQQGPTNVLISKNNVQVLSNSVTTAGDQSNYQFFDVKRTEDFVRSEVEAGLESLRLRQEKIGFEPGGRTLIHDAITGRLNQYVATSNNASRSQGSPLSALDVYVPPVDELPEADRNARIWSGIQVDGTLSSNAHEFTVELAVQT